MVKIAMDMLDEGLINKKTAVMRVEPNKLDELLHPVFDKKALEKANVVAKGLPASPGFATGQLVFRADDAEEWAATKKKVILVRIETSPEDLKGMHVAEGILTSRGGMESHAAIVARGMGRCCVSGAGSIKIDYKARTLSCDGITFKEGDWISLNGSTGEVYEGRIATIGPELPGEFGAIMDVADKYRTINIRANAETEHDCKIARNFGAQGIGLCHTEHMFFEGERLNHMREMIFAGDEAERRDALEKLLFFQRQHFRDVFSAMAGLPVTVRLLDSPLHEFLPHEDESQREMADKMGISAEVIKQKVTDLHEFNPILGHRGCRLGITYPEITEMQTRAIIEAAVDFKKEGIKTYPEIMIPLVGEVKELKMLEEIIRIIAHRVFCEKGERVDYLVGIMIETPRAALLADEIAEFAEFISFGTNDLTQMTFGYSHDDAGKFLPNYIEKGILKNNPFQILDQDGVGELIKIGIQKGRSTRNKLNVSICGVHGEEPSSVDFCVRVGMNYVSCAPFKVPGARIAAAQASIKNTMNKL